MKNDRVQIRQSHCNLLNLPLNFVHCGNWSTHIQTTLKQPTSAEGEPLNASSCTDIRSVLLVADYVRRLPAADYRLWRNIVRFVHLDHLSSGPGRQGEHYAATANRIINPLPVLVDGGDWQSRLGRRQSNPRQADAQSTTARQKSDLAKVLFANSITITPGTVTVETESDQLIVHALTDEAADHAALEDMGKRVCQLEPGWQESEAK